VEVAGRLAAELEADRESGGTEAEELRACAAAEADIQARLREGAEAVTEAEVRAQQSRDRHEEVGAELARLAGLLGLAAGVELAQVQVAAVLLVWVQNLIVVLALHAVAYWIFPRLKAPISEPPAALRALVAVDPL